MVGLKIPMDNIHFRELVSGDYEFVDKTLLIKDIQESGSKNILITRPHGFGKTYALSMLDRFYNVDYREDERRQDSFSGLNISKDPVYEGYVAEDGPKNHYPVINLDFSAIEFGDYHSFERSLMTHLDDMIRLRYGYLMESETISDDLKRTTVKDSSGEWLGPGRVVVNLCARLSLYHGVRPIILVDNYDKPMRNAIGNEDLNLIASVWGDFLRVSLKEPR